MYIFIDLDGPILDNALRLYQLYTDLLRRFRTNVLSKNFYWKLKRDKVDEEMILKKSNLEENDIKHYLKLRNKKIETKHYLKYDQIIPGCHNSLGRLSKESDLVMITTRKSVTNLFWELRQHNLRRYFKKILCGYCKNVPAYKQKYGLIIKNDFNNLKNNSIMIGDTEAEILCAHEMNVFSVGLTCGIRSLKQLKALKPNMICKDLNEVTNKLPEIKKMIQI